jgi:Type II secretion system (T2SS), protein E, N-terminal domain
MGQTTDEQLLTRIAEYHQVPFLPSLDYPVSHKTAIMIGEKFARMNITIPLMVDGFERFVVVDPQAPELFEKIAATIQRLPEFAVASEHCIRKRINEHFGVLNSATTIDIQPLSPPK